MTPPLSLYLHLPWCVRKCPYCDFNSHTAGSAPPRARYVEAVCRDLEAEAAEASGRPLASVFLGGGTPSLFSGAEIATLLDAVRASFTLAEGPDTEITMEANPGTVERHALPGYRRAGVNRLSIGAQSFDLGSLKHLGRIHGPGEIADAVRDARAAGFTNLNLDLMFALPGQSAVMARDDLRQALALAPEHLSLYQLTLEPNTVFHSRPPAGLPDDELAADMGEQALEQLAAAGFGRYEVSAFARPGRECRHNLNYWRFGDYLAAGAGAHGKLISADGVVRRYRKPAHPVAYMERVERTAAVREDCREISGDELVFEFMLNALRLVGGFTEADFERRTGFPAAGVRPRLAELAARGLLCESDCRWRPTRLGLRFLNDLQAHFLPASAAAA